MLYTTVDSPIGELLLLGDGHALHGLWMRDGRTVRPAGGLERKRVLLDLEAATLARRAAS